MDDLDTHGRVVLVRVDLNSPMGPNGEILDDIRFRGHIPTIEALKDAKTVLLAPVPAREARFHDYEAARRKALLTSRERRYVCR